MDQQQLQALEELRIIRRMMERTAQTWTGEGWVFWLIWGIGGIAAALISEGLVRTGHSVDVGIPWTLYWMVALVLTIYFARREWRRRRPPSFASRAVGATWCGVGMVFLLVGIAGAYTHAFLRGDPVIATTFLAIAGSGVFITGALIESGVLYGAAMLWWCGAILVLFIPTHFYLLEAALMAFGYLLPGYLLKIRAGGNNSSPARLADGAA